MLVKGDKIRLVKSMGAFTNVGEICEVHNVDEDGNITFKFGGGMHKGYMSSDEFNKYFEKVEPVKKEDNCRHIAEKMRVRMINHDSFLAPMKVGDEFTITMVGYGVVVLSSDDGKTTYTISENLFHKNFTVVENEENEKKNTPVSVTSEHIEDIMNRSKVSVHTAFGKCTIVVCQLPNGFVITESSACVDPKNYDEKLGVEICMKRIVDKVWELEGYKLQSEVYENSNNEYDCDCECGCDCGDCPYCDDEDDDWDDDGFCDGECSTCDCDDNCDECSHEGKYRSKNN
jgi:hypothetical protein